MCHEAVIRMKAICETRQGSWVPGYSRADPVTLNFQGLSVLFAWLCELCLPAWNLEISLRSSLEDCPQLGAYVLCSGASPLQYSVLLDTGTAGFAPGPSHSSGPERCRMHTQGNGPGEKVALGLLGRRGSGDLVVRSGRELHPEPCGQSSSLLIPHPSRMYPLVPPQYQPLFLPNGQYRLHRSSFQTALK